MKGAVFRSEVTRSLRPLSLFLLLLLLPLLPGRDIYYSYTNLLKIKI